MKTRSGSWITVGAFRGVPEAQGVEATFCFYLSPTMVNHSNEDTWDMVMNFMKTPLRCH